MSQSIEKLEGFEGPGFMATSLDKAVGLARKNSIWPLPFATSCCGIEFMATMASTYDLARFGSERLSFSPRQADLLMVMGTIAKKMGPVLRQVYEQIFYNVTGAQKIDLNSNGMVPSWLFYYQRSDANTRNQWSNYTNFPYEYPPNYITPAPTTVEIDGETYDGPGSSVNNLCCTIVTSIDNVKNILVSMSVLLDGSYRENTQASGIFNYIGKYIQTPGAAPDGLYVYNFCLDTGPYLQPTGAINMSRFHDIQLEFNTILPPPNYLAQSTAICDPDTKQIIGINKSSWNIYQYNYDLHFFEERYNILTFQSGNAGMKWAY